MTYIINLNLNKNIMQKKLSAGDIERIKGYLPSTVSHMPIEARKLAERFALEVWENGGNASSEALINLWTKLLNLLMRFGLEINL